MASPGSSVISSTGMVVPMIRSCIWGSSEGSVTRRVYPGMGVSAAIAGKVRRGCRSGTRPYPALV
jgi:hypothetical protein